MRTYPGRAEERVAAQERAIQLGTDMNSCPTGETLFVKRGNGTSCATVFSWDRKFDGGQGEKIDI